ncbi:oxidative stress defense protein [Vibrio aestuarianus]|uniref:oxidative stress defense protein n=1 Tax=Vibrio aestuarianus TaxID=28171 RepID=UPI00155980A7|nr:oxidative stress defense protein [Vibrio aestuarianus]NGZ12798.1 oxidative stress defense protein [Vibrio aestuarianus]NKZ48946.1 oxidative stress defense protein [Vibrio aestuarianus]
MKLITSVAVLTGLMSFGSWAQDMSFPHLSTTGYGEVIAVPDMAEFSVKVVESTLTAEQAKATVDKVVESFVARLKESGVTSMQISSSNLYLAPQYHYPKSGKPELIGYQATRSVTVEVSDLSKLNQYLDVALGEGINQVDKIQLKVREQEKYQQQARLAAIKDANAKARSLAEGFELKLGEVWKIDYNTPSTQPIMMRAMAMDAKSESNGYQDSTLTIRDRVDVVYKIDD